LFIPLYYKQIKQLIGASGEGAKQMKIYTQKMNGVVRATMILRNGIAVIEHLDASGAVVSRATMSAGDGQVSQFIYLADAR
jgi:hypothetical protein